MIRDLFINSTILTTFIFIAGNVFRNEPLNKTSPIGQRLLAGLGASILGIILMFFGISITEHTILDLRHFAVLLLMFYAGVEPTLFCIVVLSLFRILFFGVNTSSIIAVIILISVFLGTYFMLKLKISNLFKWMIINVYSLIVLSIAVIFVMYSFKDSLKILPTYWIISIITCLVIHYLIKYIEGVNEVFRKLKKQATIDSLTGVNNVRTFDKNFNAFIERVINHDEKLSLLLIDIDHFKVVNDTYGHPAGDEVLKQLASTINHSTRAFDVVSRVGGEEFSVLLPDCMHKRAMEVGERIRVAVECKMFVLPDDTEINITVSIGVSTLSKECIEKKDNFINEADQGLYLAKKTGRNKVCSVIEQKCTNDLCNCIIKEDLIKKTASR